MAIAVTAYVAVVLLIDALASQYVRTPVDFTKLIWRTSWGFDTFKFLVWFVIPFALSLRWMDWGALGFKRWKRVDVAILAGMVALGVAAVLFIQFIPALRDYYPRMANTPAVVKQRYFMQNLAWWASWLIGWEFMHRYFLLRAVDRSWPRWGWLIVPLFEALYHLQKHPLEMVGMFALGLVSPTGRNNARMSCSPSSSTSLSKRGWCCFCSSSDTSDGSDRSSALRQAPTLQPV